MDASSIESMSLSRAISITRILAIYAREHGCEFTIDGEVEPAVLLFSSEAFLPVIAMHADMEAKSALGRGLGLEFFDDEEALFGVSVNVSPLTGDELSVLRAAFFASAMTKIFGLSKDASRIECTPVFLAYKDGLLEHVEKNGEMKWPVATVSPH